MKKKLLIEIGHPAHIHQFRNLSKELVKLNWQVLFALKNKDIVIYLANYYELPYKIIGKTKKSILLKLLYYSINFLKLLIISLQFRPQIFVSRVSPLSGWVSFVLRKPHITFTDTEIVYKLDKIAVPFADYIFTSISYRINYNPQKHFHYPGSHELAYLHPNRFNPNKDVYKYLKLSENDKFAILRFVAWEAHHDVGEYGLSDDQKIEIVNLILKNNFKVFISSEKGVPVSLSKYTINIPYEYMHDALYFSNLLVGESPTMAEEAATLGAPSICISSWAHKTGVIQDLVESKLLFNFHPKEYDKIIKKITSIVVDDSIKENLSRVKLNYLSKRIDVTSFYSWLISNYPQSIEKLKNKENDIFNLFNKLNK